MAASEANIGRYQRGRMASRVASEIVELIEDQERKIIQRLISDYRGGISDEKILLGRVGELVALSDLYDALQAKIRLGVAAAEVEFSSGEE